ncbi:MAG: helix-turn-helix domain-containing protein [Zhenhengia sp.]|uniref:helix-turn-helix domain-containing protein n=1 Tax=Zhenhengia sp. TaxID=2944208 RepID=UPI0039923177
MMNINNMGVFISELRREANMTQFELAEILHVSHQAVSKWERLESLPDITMLPLLAETFNITVDELLKGEREAQTERSEEKTKVEVFVGDIVIDKIDQAKVALKELENVQDILESIAPLTKPKVFEEIIEGVNIDLEGIRGFLPFLGAEALEEIIHKVIEEGDLNKVDEGIYPFLKAEHKDMLIDYYIAEEKEWDEIEDIYPFLSANQQEKLMEHFMYHWMKDELEGLYPFMTLELRNSLIDLVITRGEYEMIESLIPFLNAEQKDKVIDHAKEEGVKKRVMENWAPFLNQKQLKKLLFDNL